VTVSLLLTFSLPLPSMRNLLPTPHASAKLAARLPSCRVQCARSGRTFSFIERIISRTPVQSLNFPLLRSPGNLHDSISIPCSRIPCTPSLFSSSLALVLPKTHTSPLFSCEKQISCHQPPPKAPARFARDLSSSRFPDGLHASISSPMEKLCIISHSAGPTL